MTTHWFWLGLIIACIAWYAVVTVYVAIRGVSDIAHLLERLESLEKAQADLSE